MVNKTRGLGRSLSVLLNQHTEVKTQSSTEANMLEPQKLQPGKYQPRGVIDETHLKELADSIQKQGLIQPIVVRPLTSQPDRYEIIAGERRWRASQIAGLTTIPVIIKHVDDETAMALALIENLQREDLNPLDKARAMQRLTEEFELTHQQVAEVLSKSRASVTNFIRLLQLHPIVINHVEHGDLDMGHARALLILTPPQQLEAAKLIMARQLNVRETEILAKRIKEGQSLEKKHQPIIPAYLDEIRHLSTALKTKVDIKSIAKGRGKLIIHYDNEAKLKTLIASLQSEATEYC
jgi:ParB family chromosome partitioning protein